MKYLKLFEQLLSICELQFTTSDGKKIIAIDVEVADTYEKRAMGLMGRENIPNLGGMLFIFDKEKPLSFWMKNTPSSLDIIYANTEKEIMNIVKNTVPNSTKSIPSIYPSMYVVEVASGFTDKYGIFVGDKIKF